VHGPGPLWTTRHTLATKLAGCFVPAARLSVLTIPQREAPADRLATSDSLLAALAADERPRGARGVHSGRRDRRVACAAPVTAGALWSGEHEDVTVSMISPEGGSTCACGPWARLPSLRARVTSAEAFSWSRESSASTHRQPELPRVMPRVRTGKPDREAGLRGGRPVRRHVVPPPLLAASPRRWHRAPTGPA
jgi:hypothetical protein